MLFDSSSNNSSSSSSSSSSPSLVVPLEKLLKKLQMIFIYILFLDLLVSNSIVSPVIHQYPSYTKTN